MLGAGAFVTTVVGFFLAEMATRRSSPRSRSPPASRAGSPW
jgi:hypothetical protein